MKVIDVKKLENTDRDVVFNEGRSIRPILASDDMGFSVHKTIIPKNQIGHWHYKHHLEACYCIKGSGILTDLKTDKQYKIYPDVIYALDNNDDHTFEALEDVVLISIFNPAITGNEIHLTDGSYEKPYRSILNLSKQIVQTVNCCSNNYDAIDSVADLISKT